MMRSRLWPHLAATFWIGLSGASALAAEPSPGALPSGQAADDETPRATIPEPSSGDGPRLLPTSEVLEAIGPVRRTAIYWMFGFGTPVGIVGLEGVHRFGDSFELAVGFGNGLGAEVAQPNAGFGHALQWAVMPRLRLGDDRNAFTLGAGISGGEFSFQLLCIGCDEEASGPTTYPTYYALWSNFEIGGEHWSQSGFAIRYYLGLAHATMLGAPPSSGLATIPYFGIGLGYAF
jgi:hypothetical protein